MLTEVLHHLMLLPRSSSPALTSALPLFGIWSDIMISDVRNFGLSHMLQHLGCMMNVLMYFDSDKLLSKKVLEFGKIFNSKFYLT